MKITKIEKIVITAIVVTLILAVVSGAWLVMSIQKAGEEVEEKGLKGVFEEVWEGKPKTETK